MEGKCSTITFSAFVFLKIYVCFLALLVYVRGFDDTCYCSISTLCKGCEHDLPVAGNFWLKFYKGHFCRVWVTWARSSGVVAGLYDPEPWWSGRCSLDLLEVVQNVHVVKLRQMAGWGPSAQGQGQCQGPNTLKLMWVRKKWLNLKFIDSWDSIFGFEWQNTLISIWYRYHHAHRMKPND